MVSRTLYKFLRAVILASLVAPALLTQAPADALKDPCALDPHNLIINGSMAPGHDTQYGSVADSWEPFIFDGASPRFRWVGNEQIDPNGSQQIYSGGAFDAGIWQTVRNLQPGVYYWFRLGYSLAAKSYSGPNVRVDSIGRKVGVDPFGGTDPKSPNVIWGPDYFDGQAALNISEMTMIFAARSPNATIFLRAIARDGSNGENRVWLDAVCMEAKTDMPTATPPPPTATPIPPTATPRAIQPRPAAQVVASPTRRATAPATRIAAAPTNTPPAATPDAIDMPMPADASARPDSVRYARPEVTPAADAPIDLGAGIVVGLGAILVLGALFFFVAGFLWWRHLG